MKLETNMKKILMTLAAVLCCLVTMIMVPACSKDNDAEIKNDLVGTWTEKNSLFTDILTMKEDGTFTFQSHLQLYNGSGTYRSENVTHQEPNVNYGSSGNNGYTNNTTVVRTLILNYTGKGTELLDILKCTSSKLEMTDRYGNTFHFSK